MKICHFRSLLLQAVALTVMTQQGHAQTAPGQAGATPAQDVNPGGEIIVTGSRGLQRTVTTSTAPIDVIQGGDLVKAGKPDLLGSLNALVPSFDAPARSGGLAGTIIATGGLRGLNPDQTLVLVNGKRRHKTSLIMAGSSSYNGAVPADLDLIPTSLIDHIEVLRDGAAAKYGSDAIAGVINIILKKDDKIDGSFSAGQDIDRHDGQLYVGNLHVGQHIGDKGYLEISVDAKEQDASNRANPISSAINLYPLINGQRDPREATADRLVTRNYGALPQKTLSTGYNFGYDVGGGVEIYSFGTYSVRRSDVLATFRYPNNVTSLPEIYPNGYRPDVIFREHDFEGALGVRGVVGGWDFDLSSTYGQNVARLNSIITLNPSLGPTSPTDFYLGKYRSTEWVNSLDFTKGFDVAGHLQVSAGLQHRRETFGIAAGDPLSYQIGSYVIPANQANAGQLPPPGAVGVSGITPADAGHIARNNLAAYGELTYDPSSRLTLDGAGRFEHFDDASGNTANFEASGRYKLSDWLAIRGAASTGFRAPALAQEIYSSTTGQFLLVNGVTQIVTIKILPVDSPAAIALGATPLKPEKSTNFSAGVVLTPLARLTVTADAFDIKVRNRISVTSTLGGPAVSAILAANDLPTNISAQYFTNAIGTRTRGIDVVSTYRLLLGSLGRMNLSASYNYTDTKITSIIPNPAQLSSLGANYVLFDRLTQQNIEVLLPKSKFIFDDNWKIGPITLSLRETRYGSYIIPQQLAANDRRFGGKWITDASIAWQINPHLNLAVGANNLFNTYPDANGIASAALGSQQYGASPPSPFGFTGGFYYGRISFEL